MAPNTEEWQGLAVPSARLWLQEDLEDQQMCLQMQNVTQPEAQDAKCG